MILSVRRATLSLNKEKEGSIMILITGASGNVGSV